MTHLYIELNTGLTEEVNSSIISKLYELAISGDLDNTSDLKGRLHSSTAKEKHVTYLNNNFDDLYISADTQYISFDDPDVETLMKRYIGTDDGVSLLDIQTFVNSGKAFGDGYTNTHTNRNGNFCIMNEEKALINSFDEINLFNGITSIGGSTFSGSGLTSIQLPSSITTLRASIFSNCTSLTEVTGLSNVTSFGNGVFFNCSNLEDIDLNFANLTSLGLLAFYNCTSCQFGDLNLSSITTIEKEIFRQCTGITKLTLNDNVTVSGDNAFWHCTNMTLADLGSGITFTSNGHSMFVGCTGLTTVTGMSDVTTIPRYMFADCTGLTSVDIDWTKVTTIGEYAFNNCNSLSTSPIVLSPLLTTIPRGCFKGCSNLTNIDLSNVEIINGDWLNGAFLGCSGLTTIDLSSCTSIGNSCFMKCTSLQVSNTQNVTSIGNGCFYGCSSITELYMPNLNLTGPDLNNKNNFGNCTLLSKITLGDCVTLGNDFSSTSELNVYFLNCTSLHTVDVKSLQTVPNNVGDAVFKNCPNMRNFIIRSTTVPTVQNNGNTLIKHFGGSSVKIYVPDAAVNDYKNATGWSNVSDYIYPLSQYSAS